MSDIDQQTQALDAQTDATANDATAKRGKDANSRIQELINERKSLETQHAETAKRLAEYESAQQQREQAEALKRGEHEKLLSEKEAALLKLNDEHKQVSVRVQAYEKALKSILEAQLAPLDEKQKALIPTGLDIIQQIEWLNKANEAGIFNTTPAPTPPSLHGQQTTTNNGQINLDDPKQRDAIKARFRLK